MKVANLLQVVLGHQSITASEQASGATSVLSVPCSTSALVSETIASNPVGSDIFKYVDPLIGTVNGGHVFPGASLPFSMAKAVADVNGESQGGFASDGSNITGFSHMHDDGTGGAPSLGNFPIFPHAGCENDDLNGCKFTKFDRAIPRINGTVDASPGYFAVTLESQIRAEMTVSNHTALYRFTFPQNPVEKNSILSPLILADLTDLTETRRNGSISVDPKDGRITGTGMFHPSFGHGTYTLHFCADFIGASIRDTGIFFNNRAGTEPKNISVHPDGVNVDHPLPAGAWVRFHAPTSNNQILVRVGVSFISTNQACSNAEKEIPDFNFKKTHQVARDAWSDQLSTIQVDHEGVDDNFRTTFWSGLYRTSLSPQDYTGENYIWQSDEPYYDSFYCIWDSFRSIHPLISLVDPFSQELMVRSLIDIYRHQGKLPDCRMSLCKGNTQGGSNADIVLADFFVKNISSGIDWKTGYEAVVSDAEDEPKDWTVEGRGGLMSWKNLGYIPADDYDPYGMGLFTRSVSRTVEYAYDDFCISQMSKALGHPEDAQKYIQRSMNWANLFNPAQKSDINGTETGFTGYLQPKFLNGTWGYQNPIICSPLLDFEHCYLNPDGLETYEGSIWLYTFFAPHDHANLIQTLGGPEAFVSRLDYFHESGLLYLGDEQGFLPVFQYHYAGRPAKSAERIHYYIPSQFNDTVSGIPGNDDSGAMGSFIVLSMLGIFPNAGQDVYLLTPPFFREVTVINKLNGARATIRNINFDPEYKNIYIQSARLNGEVYTRSWITHRFFKEGGLLELTLGPEESAWGTRVEDLPPSLPLRSMPSLQVQR